MKSVEEINVLIEFQNEFCCNLKFFFWTFLKFFDISEEFDENAGKNFFATDILKMTLFNIIFSFLSHLEIEMN